MIRYVALAALIGLTTPALASSDAAWKTLYSDARSRCIRASGFRNARTTTPVVFSDRSAQVALLVTGTFRQASLRGATGSSLCLYDRKRGTAEVQEVTGWRSAG